MRKEFYNSICQVLKTAGGGAIKHIDLWNHNVEFLEQEQAWPRPAVFVEFSPIIWIPLKADQFRGTCAVKLHIVTDWCGSTSEDSDLRAEALDVFDFSEMIQTAIQGMTGETFSAPVLIATNTCHNHDEILENIEEYQVRCTRDISQ